MTDYADWFRREAEEEAEYRFQQLRTREFVGTITPEERAELDREIAAREEATRLRPVHPPSVKFSEGVQRHG